MLDVACEELSATKWPQIPEIVPHGQYQFVQSILSVGWRPATLLSLVKEIVSGSNYRIRTVQPAQRYFVQKRRLLRGIVDANVECRQRIEKLSIAFFPPLALFDGALAPLIGEPCDNPGQEREGELSYAVIRQGGIESLG